MVVDEIIRPNVARIFGLDRYAVAMPWAAPTLAWTFADLQAIALPQAVNTFLVDALLPAYQGPDPTVAIAWVILGQLPYLLLQLGVAVGPSLVVERGALELEQGTSPRFRDAVLNQHVHDLALCCDIYSFFAITYLSASTSRSRSASSRLRRTFSFSSSLSRCTSLTDMLP